MHKCKLCGRYIEDLTEDLASRILEHLEKHEEYTDCSKYEGYDTDQLIEKFFSYIPNSCTISYDANNNPIVVISDVRFRIISGNPR